MNFSELFIRRPIMTLLLTISITVFGIQVFRRLPVNDLPAVDYPVIQVSVTYPGASPETMANTCATPLEKQFLQISGLEIVTSTNQTGQSTLVLQFSLDKSLGDDGRDQRCRPKHCLPGRRPVRREEPHLPSFSERSVVESSAVRKCHHRPAKRAAGLFKGCRDSGEDRGGRTDQQKLLGT